MAVSFASGFNITSKEAVDARILKTKEEMLNMTAIQEMRMPDKYFCICKDDGKMYFYDKNVTPSGTTGKFKVIDDTISDVIEADAGAHEAIASAIENSESIQNKIDLSVQEALDNGSVNVPTATDETKGTVVGSSNIKNKIAVESDGSMSVNEIGVEKITNTDGIILIMNGGGAPVI